MTGNKGLYIVCSMIQGQILKDTLNKKQAHLQDYIRISRRNDVEFSGQLPWRGHSIPRARTGKSKKPVIDTQSYRLEPCLETIAQGPRRKNSRIWEEEKRKVKHLETFKNF